MHVRIKLFTANPLTLSTDLRAARSNPITSKPVGSLALTHDMASLPRRDGPCRFLSGTFPRIIPNSASFSIPGTNQAYNRPYANVPSWTQTAREVIWADLPSRPTSHTASSFYRTAYLIAIYTHFGYVYLNNFAAASSYNYYRSDASVECYYTFYGSTACPRPSTSMSSARPPTDYRLPSVPSTVLVLASI